jgi:hypothetical protein
MRTLQLNAGLALAIGWLFQSCAWLSVCVKISLFKSIGYLVAHEH